MLRSSRAICLIVAAWILGGCVDGFDGSYVQFTLDGFRAPCDVMASAQLTLPADWQPCSGDAAEDRLRFHYELWAVAGRRGVFQIAAFDVRSTAHLAEQLALEKDGALLSSGERFFIDGDAPFESLTEARRKALEAQMGAAAAVYAIVSASEARYEEGKRLGDDYYVGNPFTPQRPRNGGYLGQVLGPSINGGANVGGAALRVPFDLSPIDSLFITIEQQSIEREDKSPSPLVVVKGASRAGGRGTLRVDARGLPGLNASFGIYESLGDRELF